MCGSYEQAHPTPSITVSAYCSTSHHDCSYIAPAGPRRCRRLGRRWQPTDMGWSRSQPYASGRYGPPLMAAATRFASPRVLAGVTTAAGRSPRMELGIAVSHAACRDVRSPSKNTVMLFAPQPYASVRRGWGVPPNNWTGARGLLGGGGGGRHMDDEFRSLLTLACGQVVGHESLRLLCPDRLVLPSFLSYHTLSFQWLCLCASEWA